MKMRGVGDGVREMERFLEQWQMDAKALRRRMILAPTPRERERWYAILLLAQGWTASGTAEALERDPHTIGRWAPAFGEGGPAALIFEQTGGHPPALGETQQAELKAAVEELPEQAGIELSNWYWKVVRQFVSERFDVSLSRSSCLNYLHRLGFAFKRPKKHLLKADEAKREAFVAQYAALSEEAIRSGAKIFFADEAHFRADAELRGKWVLRGESAPRFHEGRLWWTPAARAMGRRPATTRRFAWRPARACPRESGGGMDGTGGEQQLRNISRLPGTTEGEALWAAGRDLGQRAGTPR